MLEEIELEEVETFNYLGSMIDKKGGTGADVGARIDKAGAAFLPLNNIWSSNAIASHTNIRLFSSNIISILLYRTETRRTTKTRSSGKFKRSPISA